MSKPAYLIEEIEPTGQRLTPELEAASVTDPGKIVLWRHPRQCGPVPPDGLEMTVGEVYAHIRQDDQLHRTLSLAHLRWCLEHPPEFRQRLYLLLGCLSATQHILVCAAGTVSVDYVPALERRDGFPNRIVWLPFDRAVGERDYTGLRHAPKKP